MKKERNFFSGIKSVYFMLFACLTLSICATSCSSDEFETNLPEEQRQYTKAELIEQALSRMPQTRGVDSLPVRMVTIKDTVTIRVYIIGSMEIYWGDDSMELATGYKTYKHIYSDNLPSHGICIKGSRQAIRHLHVQDNGLIYLDVTSNTNLQYLDCMRNYLDELDLTECANLKSLHVANNNLSFINIIDLEYLTILQIEHNRLTHIDVSQNTSLNTLGIGGNKITDIDLSKNTSLSHINFSGLSLRTVNNRFISDTSFSIFPNLRSLDVSYTSFTSLDLSDNPLLFSVDISGSDIIRLDISNVQIGWLDATLSKLTELVYTKANMIELYNLQIEGTPYEKVETNTLSLVSDLPDRNVPDENGMIVQGHLYTHSQTIMNSSNLLALTLKNWVVNE